MGPTVPAGRTWCPLVSEVNRLIRLRDPERLRDVGRGVVVIAARLACRDAAGARSDHRDGRTDTVQTPVLFDANDTSRPDDAVAVRSTVPAGANVVSDGSVKSIDRSAFATPNVCVTSVAAL